MPHLFYTNILVQKHNKFVFNKTTSRTFNFEAIDIHHHSCPSSYKLLDDPSKTTSLHTTIPIKQDVGKVGNICENEKMIGKRYQRK